MITRRLTKGIAAGAGIAAVSMLTATAAFAGPPYVVSANGVTTGSFAASASASSVKLIDLRSGAILTCVTSEVGTPAAPAATGTLGSHASGSGVAQIKSLIFTTCTGPGGLQFTVAASPSAANPAQLNVSGSTASGVTPATVSNVTAAISGHIGSPTGPTCNFNVSGDPVSATVPATVSGSYQNGTATAKSILHVSSGSTTATAQLYINNVTGTASAGGACISGAIKNGDPAQYVGDYTVDAGTGNNPLNVTG